MTIRDAVIQDIVESNPNLPPLALERLIAAELDLAELPYETPVRRLELVQ